MGCVTASSGQRFPDITILPLMRQNPSPGTVTQGREDARTATVRQMSPDGHSRWKAALSAAARQTRAKRWRNTVHALRVAELIPRLVLGP